MLYPTHKRFGLLWGFLAFPVGVSLGVIPIISLKMSGMELFMVILCSYLGIRGALFGARFPDIDSKSSIPRKRHPMIGRIFDLCGVKHRGRYSHDFFSIGLTFGIIYLIVSISGENFIQAVASGHSLAGTVGYVSMIIFVWVLAISAVDVILWFANVTKNRRMWAIVNSRRIIYAVMIAIPLFLLLIYIGVLNFKPILTGIPISQAMPNAILLVVASKIYVVFTLVGAYSHLFADILTKSGVSIFFIKIAPMKVVAGVRKIPLIGKIIVPLDPKTGGKWEDLVRLIVTIACVPAAVFAFLSLFGHVS